MWEPLSRFMDLLKLTGWQTAMVAIGAAIFLFLTKKGYLPATPIFFELVLWAVLIFSVCLAAAAAAPHIQQQASNALARRRAAKARELQRQAFIEDIPYLTEHERDILGYLRHHKQKRFSVASDGGYASTLIAKGYVRCIGIKGQQFHANDVPCEVAAFVSEIMEQRPDDFPHRPKYSDRPPRVEVHPWRVPWMAR